MHEFPRVRGRPQEKAWVGVRGKGVARSAAEKKFVCPKTVVG